MPEAKSTMSYLEYVRMIVEDDPDPIRASMIAIADIARAKMTPSRREDHRAIAQATLDGMVQRGKTAEDAYKALSGLVFSFLIGLSEIAGDPDDEEGGAS